METASQIVFLRWGFDGIIGRRSSVFVARRKGLESRGKTWTNQRTNPISYCGELPCGGNRNCTAAFHTTAAKVSQEQSETTSSPEEKPPVSVLCSSFNVNLPSGSDKTAALATSTLVLLAAATVYLLLIPDLLLWFFRTSDWLSTEILRLIENGRARFWVFGLIVSDPAKWIRIQILAVTPRI